VATRGSPFEVEYVPEPALEAQGAASSSSERSPVRQYIEALPRD
jgi:hypothetical protein